MFQSSFQRRSTCRPRNGYTLVELVMALAIIVTLAGIAVPRYARATANYRVRAAAQRIVNDIALAQQTARTQSLAQAVVFWPDRDRYALPGHRHLDTGAAQYLVNLSDEPYRASIKTFSLNTGTIIAVIPSGGSGTLTFNGWGVPDQSATITLQSGTATRTVFIDAATGRAIAQ